MQAENNPEHAAAEQLPDGLPSAAELAAREPLFSNLPKRTLARVLPHIRVVPLVPGETLIQSGQPASHLYFILEGKVEVSVPGAPTELLGHGFVGQEASLGMDQYVVSVAATTAGLAFCIPEHAVEDLSKIAFVKKELVNGFGRTLRHEVTNGSEPPPSELEVAARLKAEEKGKSEASSEDLRKLLGWFLALVIPYGVYYFSDLYGKLPNQESAFLLAIVSATVVMWIFRLMPDFVPALFAVMAIALLGLAPTSVAFSGFASSTLFMALSIFGLSAVITASGLSYRILLWLLRIGPANKAWYFLSLFLSGTALSIMVPTANGRVAIVTPFIGDLLASFDRVTQKSEAPRLAAAVIGGVSLLSSVFLSAKTVNFLVYGLMPIQEQARFQWLDWFISAAVFGAVLLFLYLVAAFTILRTQSNPHIPKALIRDQIRTLGAMSPAEWAGTLGLLVLLVSFLTAKLHHIDIPWVALAILYSLLMFGFLSQKNFKSGVDWTFLVFLAALIGLVSSIEYVELDKWLESQLTWLVEFMQNDFALFVLVLYICISVVRLALPINATVVVFATLLMPAAFAHGVTPWLIGFLILVIAENFVWPYQASYYSQMVSMSEPHYQSGSGKVLGLNFLIYFLKLAAIYASIPYWQMLGLL